MMLYHDFPLIVEKQRLYFVSDKELLYIVILYTMHNITFKKLTSDR